MNPEDSLTTLHAETDRQIDGARRRRHIMAPVLSGLVVIAVAVAIGTTFARPPELIPQPESAPTEFALNRLHLSVGWLPESDGYAGQPMVDLAPKAQRIWYLNGADDLSDLKQVWVWQFAAAVTPTEVLQQPGHGPAEVIDAPAVNGRPAVYFRSDGVIREIAWQWEGEAWAVAGRYNAGTDNAEVLHRIAESVRTDLDEPVRLPFTVEAPEGARLIRVSSNEGGALSFALSFALDEPSASDLELNPYQYAPAATPKVTVSVVPPGGPFDLLSPTTTIGGHPAGASSSVLGSLLVLFDVDAYDVVVQVTGVGASSHFSAQQAQALALSVVPLGPPSDTSQWTDSPLR
jgi:hypothetical protein